MPILRVILLKLLLFTAGALASDSDSLAQQRPASAIDVQPIDAQPIKVVTELLPPYQVIDSNGNLSGFSTKIVTALFQLTGDKHDIQAMPWPRAYSIALKERNVMIYSLAWSQARQRQFHWIGTLQTEHGYLWGLKSEFAQPFTTIDQAREYWITTSQNSNPHGFLQRNGFTKINVVSNPEQNVSMLFRNRTQLAIGTEIPFRYMAKRNGFDFADARKMFKVDDISVDLKLAFGPNTDKRLIEKYRKAFDELEASGTLVRLRQQWGFQ